MSRAPGYDYRVIKSYLVALNCPRSLTVLILLNNNQFDDIVNLSFNPLDYNNCEDARLALLATDLLRKHEDLPTNIDRDHVAAVAFEKAEQQCRDTNDRVYKRNACAAEIFSAQRKIARILGDFDPDELLELAGWGPGSTFSIKRREASISNKFRREAEFTPALGLAAKHWLSTISPRWQPKPVIVVGNKVITVPKNAKTNRTIAVEPSMNLFLQRGVGGMIRRRLRFVGVDLNDQSRNQMLAQLGSKDGKLTTVDFSSASDTIASALVFELLPPKWFDVLYLLRSRRGVLKSGQVIEYEKFSSMGNGYTFELESLIFYALCLAVVPEDHPLREHVSVYGDDVIIPTDCYDAYLELCAYCGFTINNQKSFSTGYYRESCGKHYWNGVDVTPVYLRRYLQRPQKKVRKASATRKKGADEVAFEKPNLEAMRFHNRVVELSRRTIGDGFRDSRFRPCINFLYDTRPHTKRPYIVPPSLGDLGYHRGFDECAPCYTRDKLFLTTPCYARDVQRGFYTYGIQEVNRCVEEDDEYLALARYYSLWKQGDNVADVSLGNKVTYSLRKQLKPVRLWVADWCSFGPWL